MFNTTLKAPETAGIPSKHIQNMIARLEKLEIPMHSVLIARNDQLIYEGYYKPYSRDTLHRMFSISKTLTALAIGHLITLGKLSLNDRIAELFPEKCPQNIHPWIKEMTIRNMLEMRTCHSTTTYKLDMKSDWVESFFTAVPDHPAGTVFHYDTSSAHVLCALVEKITGKLLYNYIREDVLFDLALSEDGFMLSDPFGVSMGGSGLCCTPLDLMKIGSFLLHEGCINGKQIIDKTFLKEAVSNLNPTVVKSPLLNENQGYGFQIWRNAWNGYTAYGMGGQFILAIPDKKLLFVTTADTQGYPGANAEIHLAFFEEIADKLCDDAINATINKADTQSLQALTQSLSITPVKGAALSSYSNKVNNISYQLLENRYGLTKATIHIDEHHGTLSFSHMDGCAEIHFGLGSMQDGLLSFFDLYYTASAAWLNDETLYIKCHICDSSVGSVHIQLHFKENQLTIYQRIVEETLSKEFPSCHFVGYCV